MAIKIVFYTELARIFGKEIQVTVNKCKTVKDLLDDVLKNKNIKFEDIYREYFILVNGRAVKPEHRVKDKDNVHVLPKIIGGKNICLAKCLKISTYKSD